MRRKSFHLPKLAFTAHPASMSRILLLDLLLFLIQLTSLIVSYVNYHSNGTSSLDSFPFDDLLLPPSRSTLRNISAFEDDDVDLETGELAPNRRKSRNASYKLLDGDADGESLDEDDEPTPHTSRKGECFMSCLSRANSKDRLLVLGKSSHPAQTTRTTSDLLPISATYLQTHLHSPNPYSRSPHSYRRDTSGDHPHRPGGSRGFAACY